MRLDIYKLINDTIISMKKNVIYIEMLGDDALLEHAKETLTSFKMASANTLMLFHNLKEEEQAMLYSKVLRVNITQLEANKNLCDQIKILNKLGAFSEKEAHDFVKKLEELDKAG